MKEMNRRIENAFRLSKTEEIIGESENLIKSLDELIEMTKKMKSVKCDIHIKMEKFPKIRCDSVEAVDKIGEYKELLLEVDSNMESLTSQVNNIKFERSE